MCTCINIYTYIHTCIHIHIYACIHSVCCKEGIAGFVGEVTVLNRRYLHHAFEHLAAEGDTEHHSGKDPPLPLSKHTKIQRACLAAWHDARERGHPKNQHTSAYVSIRQHTSAYVSIPGTMLARVGTQRITKVYIAPSKNDCMSPSRKMRGCPTIT